MAFPGFHSLSTLNDAERNVWHHGKNERKPCAKFTNPNEMNSFDFAPLVLFIEKPRQQTQRVGRYRLSCLQKCN